MTCNNPNGCDCANQKFCKWYGPEKKKAKKGLKKASSPMRKTNLKKQSNKAKQVSLLYRQLRNVFLKKNPKCWVKKPGCTQQATQVHHLAGRGMNTTKVLTFIAICHGCHEWVHKHPNQARKEGWLE